jgi:hypothetical protein
MRARNLLLVAAVFAAVVAAWVIGHPASSNAAIQPDAQAHLIRPFGT